jgi:hypothetical protein
MVLFVRNSSAPTTAVNTESAIITPDAASVSLVTAVISVTKLSVPRDVWTPVVLVTFPTCARAQLMERNHKHKPSTSSMESSVMDTYHQNATATATIMVIALRVVVLAILGGVASYVTSLCARTTALELETAHSLAIATALSWPTELTAATSVALATAPTVANAIPMEFVNAMLDSTVRIAPRPFAQTIALAPTESACQLLVFAIAMVNSPVMTAPTAPTDTRVSIATSQLVPMIVLAMVCALLPSLAIATRVGLVNIAKQTTALTTAQIVVIVWMDFADAGRAGRVLNAPFQFAMVDPQPLAPERFALVMVRALVSTNAPATKVGLAMIALSLIVIISATEMANALLRTCAFVILVGRVLLVHTECAQAIAPAMVFVLLPTQRSQCLTTRLHTM